MIVGAGIDIVEIARVERALERRGNRIRERLFTPQEREDCDRGGHSGRHFALRFAAKEAGMKAIGTGWRRGVGWRDFETTEREGSLGIEIHGRALEIAHERRFTRAWLGASVTRTHAMAHVVLEGPPGGSEPG